MCNKKPKICELLGVELEEEFEFGGWIYKITGQDVICKERGSQTHTAYSCDIMDMLEHPERIKHKRKFTEQEKSDAETLKRLLGIVEIQKGGTCGTILSVGDEKDDIWLCSQDVFPSIKPGESFTVDEIIGEK